MTTPGSGSGPLAGRTVLVTLPAEESEGLVALLEARGATTIVSPVIEIRPAGRDLSPTLAEVAAGRFEWMTVTSRATVRVLREAIDPGELRTRVAAVGERTADAFTAWAGRAPDLVPRVFETQALAEAFPPGSGRVLCLRADIAPPGLEAALRKRGWRVVRATAYRTVLARRFSDQARRALLDGSVDAITFTSASTVRGFARAMHGPPATNIAGRPSVVCIGPVTAREARSMGFAVHAVARPHTTEALAEALERAFRRRPNG